MVEVRPAHRGTAQSAHQNRAGDKKCDTEQDRRPQLPSFATDNA
jgi:hypothetical protein